MMPLTSFFSQTGAMERSNVQEQNVPQHILERSVTYKTISVIGLGYVGLPTALLFAIKGFNVIGIDISPRILTAVETNTVASLFPELAPWWEETHQSGRFKAAATPQAADAFFITVPTPWDKDTRTCDLDAVNAAIDAIIPVLRPGNLVVLESTVPPGTTRDVLQPKLEAAGFEVGRDIHLCFSPERILPGNTVHELVNNNRVLGGTTLESAMLAKALLSKVIEGEIFITNDVTAEFCKLAENTFRDVNIALANELSLVADRLGVNIFEALPIINQHPRVNLHKPGIGVGGHCIAVDPWFFVEAAPEVTPLIATARKVNDGMPAITVQKILNLVKEVENPRILLVGLTYKPDVADLRESPAVEVVEILKAQGVDVKVFDPLLSAYQGQTLLEQVSDMDLVAVLVNHRVIQAELSLSRNEILSAMRTPQIVVF